MNRSRSGFLLVDALVGIALLGLLLTGLHQLRGVQARSLKNARARLAAAETASAAALVIGLTPGAAGDISKRREALERFHSWPGLSVTTAPLADGRTRVIARVPWRAGSLSGTEEASALAVTR